MMDSIFLPSGAGEVSPTYGDGGVMTSAGEKHAPSARCVGGSPRKAWGGWVQ